MRDGQYHAAPLGQAVGDQLLAVDLVDQGVETFPGPEPESADLGKGPAAVSQTAPLHLTSLLLAPLGERDVQIDPGDLAFGQR